MKKMQLIAIAMAAAAFAFVSVSEAGIALTRHNLGNTGMWNFTDAGAGGKYVGADGNQGDTSEICVFCHTPHGGQNVGIGPLWNRDFNAGGLAAYSLYDSWTIDGANGSLTGAGNYTGSMLCLSCHDGTQAMDNLINAPTTPTGNGYGNDGAGSDQGWGWTESKWMSSGIIQFELAYIGTDLTDDHPVMIQYGGGGLSSGGGTVGDTHFFTPSTAVKNGTTYWYFDTDATAGFSGGDVKMYTYNQGATGDEPFVECYTCHDPHVETNRPFLRMYNAGSALCLTC
ncbi:MAG: cytochrome c3 family protein, partial [Mariprofundaceae bacterium]